MKKSVIIAALGGVALCGVAAAHAADAWPARPIRLIAPFPAGSSVDAAARVITPRVAEALGQSIVIDNRAGAGKTAEATIFFQMSILANEYDGIAVNNTQTNLSVSSPNSTKLQ